MVGKLRKRWRYRRAVRRYKNRNITRARFLYLYFMIGGISMFLYAISSIVFKLPFYFTFAPIAMLLVGFLITILRKNWKMIWLYIRDMEQGSLLLYLNSHTHFGEEHKMKLLNWVYLRRKTIRNETRSEIANKKELTKSDRRLLKYRVVMCPQQLLDGINKAILVNALIYAHQNIQVLDNELRDILELSDENIRKFNLQTEINRCKTSDVRKQIDKYTEIGMKAKEKRK